MDPKLEAFLYAELGLSEEWFPWKVEALVAAGVLSDDEGEWWLARSRELYAAPDLEVSEDLRERIDAMALDCDTMIELHRAGVVDDAQLLEVARREGDR